ncbi:RNA polymerase factor sigma-54 [Peribacillus frigoritolerans]|uniref:RNA polymerase factor sigma-54 n=1 Tax=Peribacillus frigoritolerans TaxID=450367 RepID=UPI001059A42F|nr:RNA polymerase factor sigma-54 [Peribacillus frigoritolerans]TDL78862.1 RNA polymerase factor sigma-54 [Peribacillus frigoritolerans]
MDMKVGLFQEQSLKLNMTQELKQAITLLQYSSMELASYIEDLTLENPLIELKEKPESGVLYHTSSRTKMTSSSKNSDMIENVSSLGTTLQQHLEAQLLGMKLTPSEKRTLHILIQALDPNGYIEADLSVLSDKFNLSADELNQQLTVLQKLDPAGVGARNLQECISIQLARLPQRNKTAELIVKDYFYLFAEKSWKELAKKTKLDLKEIQNVQDFIKTLHPRPGLAYHHVHDNYIVPELTVAKVHGEWQVMYNDDISPKVAVNSAYESNFSSIEDSEVKHYLTAKLNQCRWLIKTLNQRKETMMKVMKEIVRRQTDFFEKGELFMKPLTLKVVADAIEVHESTVSRTVREKYVQTPHGLYELKFFFSNGLEQSSQEITSSTVKTIIEQMIEKEDKLAPLSDQKIVSKLAVDHQIDVSRRTVAKYRDQLGIASSSARKRY